MFGFVMIMTCEGGRTNRQGFKTDLRSQNRQGFKTDLVSKGVGAEEDLSLSRDKMLFCGQRGQEGKRSYKNENLNFAFSMCLMR